MATKYARGVGGNWSADATWSLSSGGAADTVAPTAADDVILDGASGNVTIDSGATRYCRSLDCDSGSAYAGTLTHTNAVSLYIGDATPGAGNRALRFSSGMTYTVGGTSALLRFDSSSATVQTVTTAGKTVGQVTAAGVGGSWQQLDAMTSVSDFTHARGTWDTNGFALSFRIFDTNNSNTRTLTLGSSSITLSFAGTAWNAATVTNLTVTANTATVTLSGAAAIFNGGSQNWNGMSVVFTASLTTGASIQGGNFTLANLTVTGTAIKTNAFYSSINPTITGTFTVTGNSATNRMLVASNTLGTARTITAAAVSLTNVDFRDITGAGAATWSGTSVGNALGNTNITPTTPVTVTHNAGAAGNWSTAANWDTGKVPLCHDTVVIPATTTGTLTNDMPRMGANISFANGFAGTFSNSVIAECYGSWTNGTGMTVAGTANISFLGRSSLTITSAGKTWTSAVLLASPSGTYTLADAFAGNRNQSPIFTLSGAMTFSDGGFSVTASSTAYGLSQSAGTSNLTGTWTISATTPTATVWSVTGGTVNASTVTIILSGATATDRTFAGGGKTYGTLTDQNTSTGKLTITGANTFTTINKTATVACTLTLPSATTTTVTNFNVNGIAGNLLTLNSSTPASAAILSKPTGLVSCDYLSIQDSTATGGARYFAGTHSTNVSGNTGWNFIAPTYNTSSTGIIA